jgi:hypothetical protein
LIALAIAGYSRPADVPSSYLQKHVCRFIFHGRDFRKGIEHERGHGPVGISGAVRSLAEHAEVPVCFEALRSSPDEAIVPIEINAKNTTVKEILDQVVSQDRRYVYRERFGLVEVLPQGADRDPTDCLNTVIPVFRVRYDWNGLIEQLRCEVDIVSRDPKAVVPFPGCGGSYPGLPHPPPGLIGANFENQTVRDILTLLCAKVGNMAWTASFDAPRPSCQHHAIGVYQPRRWSPSDTVPLTWSRGLPEACLKCHYHEPCRSK